MSDPVFMFHLADGKTVIAYVAHELADYVKLHRPCEIVPMRREPRAPIEIGFVPYLSMGNTLPPIEDLPLPKGHVIHKRPAPKDIEDGYREAVSGIILT